MKIYFEKTNGGNQVIMTDGETAKIFDASPSGVYEGIDLYAEDAEKKLKKHFSDLEECGDLNVFDEIYSDNETNFEDVIGELENAILVFSN